jgi:hypothetical protein
MIWSVLRRAALTFVLVAFAAGGLATAFARSASSGTPITKAQAEAFAQAVNLRASDLPGATSLQGAIFGPEAVQYQALKCGRQSKTEEAPVGGGESWLSDSQKNLRETLPPSS